MSRDLKIISISLFIWGIGESAFLYFQSIYLEKLGASPVAIGSILALWGFLTTIMMIPAGYLSDHVGCRPVLWATWVLGLIATWIMAVAKILPVFVAGLLLYGLSVSVIPPLNSYITAARGSWSVGRALTIVYAANNAGYIFGPIVGGFIGDQYGLRIVYFFAAFLVTMSTGLIFWLRPLLKEATVKGKSPKQFWLDGRLTVYIGLVFFAIFASTLPQPFASNFLQNERGLSLAQIGQLGSTTGIGIVLFNLIMGGFQNRQGFILCQLSVGLFALMLLTGSSFPIYMIGYLLLGGYRVARVLAVAQASHLVEANRLGFAYGVIETASSVAAFLAPLLAGFLYRLSPGLTFQVGVVLITISLILSIAAIPEQTNVPLEVQE